MAARRYAAEAQDRELLANTKFVIDLESQKKGEKLLAAARMRVRKIDQC